MCMRMAGQVCWGHTVSYVALVNKHIQLPVTQHAMYMMSCHDLCFGGEWLASASILSLRYESGSVIIRPLSHYQIIIIINQSPGGTSAHQEQRDPALGGTSATQVRSALLTLAQGGTSAIQAHRGSAAWEHVGNPSTEMMMKTEFASSDEPRCSQEQSSPTEGHLGASPHAVW